MYWLYVILFVCTLIVPGFVEQGWLPTFGSRGITEMVFLFLFATMAFVLYIIRDYQFLRYEKRAQEKQKEVSHLTKELSSSYSYIGEVNRKFEILQDVTLEIPTLLENGVGKGKRSVYFDALRAMRIFSGCRDFVVVLLSLDGSVRPKELFLPDSDLTGTPREVDVVQVVLDKVRFTKKNGQYFVIEANGAIGGFHCVAVFRKSSIRNDVVDLVRPLLMQTLLLWVYSNKMKNLPISDKEGKIGSALSL